MSVLCAPAFTTAGTTAPRCSATLGWYVSDADAARSQLALRIANHRGCSRIRLTSKPREYRSAIAASKAPFTINKSTLISRKRRSARRRGA